MSVLEKLFTPEIATAAFKQLREHLSSKKVRQLMTGKPIEVHEGESIVEIDTATIHLQYKSYLENLIQRRISKALNFFNLDFNSRAGDYKFQVVIRAMMHYSDICNFLKFHFANRPYLLMDDTVTLLLDDFSISEKNNNLMVSIPFHGKYERKWVAIHGKGVIHIEGNIKYISNKYIVEPQNIDYTITTRNMIIKYIDYKYHTILLDNIKSILTVNIEEELFSAKIAAQEQINDIQAQQRWVSGIISSMDLERFSLKSNGIQAVFVADGDLQLLP